MDLNNIKVFISVVDSGSFSRASQQLAMPSTTVSRKVVQLETMLGVKLLHRSTRKLTLTQEGINYYQLCQQHLLAIESASELLMESQSTPKGHIRISAPFDFAMEYAQSWIMEFLKRYPQITIELDTSDSYINMIEDRIDIAFRSGQLDDSSLIARRIGPKHNICCASANYLKKSTPIAEPKDLRQQNCLTLGQRRATGQWHFFKDDQRYQETVTGRYSSTSLHLIVKAALNDLGIAYVPIALVKDYIKDGRLTHVLADYTTPESNMFIVYHANQFMTKPIRLFIDFVINKVSPAAPWQIDTPTP